MKATPEDVAKQGGDDGRHVVGRASMKATPEDVAKNATVTALVRFLATASMKATPEDVAKVELPLGATEDRVVPQ